MKWSPCWRSSSSTVRRWRGLAHWLAAAIRSSSGWSRAFAYAGQEGGARGSSAAPRRTAAGRRAPGRAARSQPSVAPGRVPATTRRLAGTGEGSQATPPPARSIRCRPSTTSTTRPRRAGPFQQRPGARAEVAADIVVAERAAQVREQAVLGRLAALGLDEVAEHELVRVAARAVVRVAREQRRGAAARRTGDDGARPVRVHRDVDGDQLVPALDRVRDESRGVGLLVEPRLLHRVGRVLRRVEPVDEREQVGARRGRRWRAAPDSRGPGNRSRGRAPSGRRAAHGRRSIDSS